MGLALAYSRFENSMFGTGRAGTLLRGSIKVPDSVSSLSLHYWHHSESVFLMCEIVLPRRRTLASLHAVRQGAVAAITEHLVAASRVLQLSCPKSIWDSSLWLARHAPDVYVPGWVASPKAWHKFVVFVERIVQDAYQSGAQFAWHLWMVIVWACICSKVKCHYHSRWWVVPYSSSKRATLLSSGSWFSVCIGRTFISISHSSTSCFIWSCRECKAGFISRLSISWQKSPHWVRPSIEQHW